MVQDVCFQYGPEKVHVWCRNPSLLGVSCIACVLLFYAYYFNAIGHENVHAFMLKW